MGITIKLVVHDKKILLSPLGSDKINTKKDSKLDLYSNAKTEIH